MLVPTYMERLSREWNSWLEFWADSMINTYYSEV